MINQCTQWLSDGVDTGMLFKDYNQRQRAWTDVAQDDTIDLTADSPFLDSISDASFNAVLNDFPTCESAPNELVELMSALGDICSYEQFQAAIAKEIP